MSLLIFTYPVKKFILTATEKEMKVKIFDSTLRDGAQGGGIAFTVEDKIRIVKQLDRFGIDYAEAGNPGSNRKDIEFFRRVSGLNLKHIRLTAFGSTCKKGTSAADDPQLKALLEAETPAVAVFGKAWNLHVTKVLQTTLEENLRMVTDTVAFLKAAGREVIFDAEHFFDGYKADAAYAVKVCACAAAAGADVVVLCDTNGGAMPDEIAEAVKAAVGVAGSAEIGIHAHNDGGLAVANSLTAVAAGAVHVQGTFNGFGERCGNANLSSIIPNLQLKKGYECIPPENMVLLTETSRVINEIANLLPDSRAPFVGRSAFAHKAGMHIDGVTKLSGSFEHIDPAVIGNTRRFLMSDQAGRSLLLTKLRKIDAGLQKDSPVVGEILERLKQAEAEGYVYEDAEASFEILARKTMGLYRPFFHLKHFKVSIDEPRLEGKYSAAAMVKIEVDGADEIGAAEGDGPVNALDKALRRVLTVFYPEIRNIFLNDYKVRVIDDREATAARVRVLIRTSDGKHTWTTVGVSQDIIEASWLALVDSVEYKLLKEQLSHH